MTFMIGQNRRGTNRISGRAGGVMLRTMRRMVAERSSAGARFPAA